MPFVKLDCGMLDSTLWSDMPAREIFITALLMARPYKLDEPADQIEVSGTNRTGFVVPPGDYGFVEAAGPGIVSRSKLEEQAGLAALERLGAPDAHSRTPDFDGRRLIRVAGGFIVLNYELYRARDYTNAARQRRYRERRNTVTDGSNAVTSRHVTQAEAEAEAKKTQEGPQSGPRPSDLAELLKEIQAIYPKREGSQRWKDAESAIRQRLKEGYTKEQMLDGVRAYATYCNAKGRTGSETVLQAKTFFGENHEFLNPWTVGQQSRIENLSRLTDTELLAECRQHGINTQGKSRDALLSALKEAA